MEAPSRPEIRFDPEVSLIDSAPVAVYHYFARAYRCRRLVEESAFGYDEEMSKQTFSYGLRLHLIGYALARSHRLCRSGAGQRPRTSMHLAEELLEEAKGWALWGTETIGAPTSSQQATRGRRAGFAGSLAGSLQVQQKGRGVLAALVEAKERRRIERVICELVERYRAKRVWASRERWHLTSGFLGKVLSHTMAVDFCQQIGLSPLRFAELLTD